VITLDKEGRISINESNLVTGRTCIIGQSGSGKSYAVSVICEELCKAEVGFCIIDTEGEYSSLKQSFKVLIAGYSNDCDLSMRSITNLEALTEELITSNAPFILDVSEAPDQREAVELFSKALYKAADKIRKPYLLIIEEADVFCPQQGKTIDVISEVSRRGRKRGPGLMIVTQRPALVDKTILSQCNFQIIGKLTIEADLESVKPFFNKKFEVNKLPNLRPGEFFIKDSFEEKMTYFKPRLTPHKSVTPVIKDKSKPINEVVSKVAGFKPLSTDGLAVPRLINDLEIIKLANKLKHKNLPLIRSGEVVNNIQLNNLPLIELKVRVVNKLLFRKNHEELIICFDGLKPVVVNENYEDMFDLSGINGLSIKAVDALIALMRSDLTLKKLSKKIKLGEEPTKEVLRELFSRKYVTSVEKNGRTIYLSLFKNRIPRLKTMSTNQLKPSINCDLKIKPQLNMDSLRDIIKSINPKAEIVESKTIYYPFYELTFKNSKEELRTLMINAVTGKVR